MVRMGAETASRFKTLLIQARKQGFETAGILVGNELDLQKASRLIDSLWTHQKITEETHQETEDWLSKLIQAHGCERIPWSWAAQICRDFSPSTDGNRREHLQLRGGRETARFGGFVPAAAAGVDLRLSGHLPPKEARTQSPQSYEWAKKRESGEDYEQKIAAGIQAYMEEQKTEAAGLLVPPIPDGLISAGVPHSAAKYLVKKAAGKFILNSSAEEEKAPAKGKVLQFGPLPARERVSPRRQVERCLKAPLMGPDDQSLGLSIIGQQAGEGAIYLGAPKKDAPVELRNLWKKSQNSQRPGLRLRKIEKVGKTRTFLLTTAKELYDSYPISWESTEQLFESLLVKSSTAPDAAQTGPDYSWKMTFSFNSESVTVEVPVREHSIFWCGEEESSTFNKRTLRGIRVADLPRVLARRATRKPRKSSVPALARSNPLSSFDATPYNNPQSPLFLPDRDEGGRLLPLQDRARDASTGILVAESPQQEAGKVVYRDKDGSIRQTTRRRFNSWLQVERVGKRLHQESNRPLTAKENPLMARRSKRNPDMYMDEESWPFQWTMGPYGPGLAEPGPGRRNPRKTRKSSSKQMAWRQKFGEITRMAREIFKARGCDYGDAFREARARIEGGQRAAANPYGDHDDSEFQFVTWDQESPWAWSPEPFGPNSWPPVGRRNGRKGRR